VTKKAGGRDARQDPEGDDDTASNYRVDRVYPASGLTPRTVTQSPAAAVAAGAGQRRSRTPTAGGAGGIAPDAEIALRRQLSTLQRQLAEAQRTIADKDEEVASEVEKRLAVSTAYDNLVDEQTQQQQRIDDLIAYQTRTLGVEQRLLDTVTTAEEHARARDREKELRAQAEARVAELTAQLEDAHRTWTQERAQLEDQHRSEITKLETQKRMASDAAGAALLATTTRMRESHEEELAQLRDSNEKSLAMLRGELEPKALAALSLAEERQRLEDELAALRTETTRAAAEREETFQREHAQLVEQHTLELAQHQRTAAAELQKVSDERDATTITLQQTTRHAELREQHFDKATAAAEETRARLERELAELKLSHERVTAEKANLDERMTTASAAIEQLTEQKRSLRERLELAEGEARRNALDRKHFIAYLEEGLAQLRDAEDPDVTISGGDEDPSSDETTGSGPAPKSDTFIGPNPTLAGSAEQGDSRVIGSDHGDGGPTVRFTKAGESAPLARDSGIPAVDVDDAMIEVSTPSDGDSSN